MGKKLHGVALLQFVLVLCFLYVGLLSAERSTYIVHMDKSLMPKAFTGPHHWYSSTVDSIKYSTIPTSSNGHDQSTILYTYDHAIHGFCALLSKDEVERLKKSPGFLSAYSDKQEPTSKFQRVDFDDTSLERDPGLRIPIWQHPINTQDEIRRAYIKVGPYQPHLSEYPRSVSGKQHRRFQYSWFKQFPWLEYSPSKDALFCFPCFLFETNASTRTAFTIEGFRSWKRVNDGNRCALLNHVGCVNSPHNNAIKSVEGLSNVARHIDKVINAQSLEEIQKNRLRLRTTIESVRWLSLQACAFRGHDESLDSNNPGNLIAMIKLMGKLNVDIDNVVASPKRQNELQCAQAAEVEHMLATGERETGRGANQIGTLHRAGTTRWSSHFSSICSLVDMYGATIKVLQTIVEEGSSNSIRGEAGGALIAMRSFDFIFILHLMHRIMGITDLLCRVLQHKSLDILNAMDLVSTTKALLQTLRQDGFDTLLMHVGSVCTQYDIEMPMMDARYKEFTGRSCQQRDHITMEHHYRVDIFNAVIDFQLGELNNRFNEGAMELLVLSSALEPRDGFKSLEIDKICTLAEKFYPGDFTNQEMHYLRCQLEHYKLDVPQHEKFQNMSTISELCQPRGVQIPGSALAVTGLWPASDYGKDVIVGVIDTGVWPESKSYDDHGMTEVPSRWKGACEEGQEFKSSMCNSKLIGARRLRTRSTVDVISISMGFDIVPLYKDPIAIASFGAMEKGVFVSSSAGNAGHVLGRLHNGIPWALTVAAGSIDRRFSGTLTLGNGLTITGWSMFPIRALVQKLPLIYNTTLSSCNSTELLFTAPYGILICDETVSFFYQIDTISASHAPAAVFIADDPAIFEYSYFPYPGVVINPKDASTLINYAKIGDTATASIEFQQTIVGTKPAPAVSTYTSRGPSPSYPSVLKPDVMAPGTLVLAAWIPGSPASRIGGLVHKFERTVTNVGSSATKYKAKVMAPKGSVVTVSPETLVFGETYEKQSYSLTIRYTSDKNRTVTSGSVIWVEENGKHMVRSPIVVSPKVKVW
ncbi:subtilase family protein [Actinidia rufa]|uniref:Subtilase family protein n=1 Tax=Actinidia rufa TaxID=165716 RepID=A0A7J0FHF8_9ERIC|nr:subtilase family protein [Actinidia rufa]